MLTAATTQPADFGAALTQSKASMVVAALPNLMMAAIFLYARPFRHLRYPMVIALNYLPAISATTTLHTLLRMDKQTSTT